MSQMISRGLRNHTLYLATIQGGGLSGRTPLYVAENDCQGIPPIAVESMVV
jgi:hypothetical protein